MVSYGTSDARGTIDFALVVLVYLECVGLLPERFSPSTRASWRGVMPYSREVDLFEMAVRDGARANPRLFAAFANATTRHELRTLDEHTWCQRVEAIHSAALTDLSPQDLYRRGAQALGVELPPIDETALQDLPPEAVGRSSLIAELPNGCGYPTLLLCQRYDVLDPAHNLRIFVDGVEAEMLAAWALVLLTGQLAPPSGRIIPVSAKDHAALQRDAFDAVLLYRPVPWLPSDPQELIAAQEVIRL